MAKFKTWTKSKKAPIANALFGMSATMGKAGMKTGARMAGKK